MTTEVIPNSAEPKIAVSDVATQANPEVTTDNTAPIPGTSAVEPIKEPEVKHKNHLKERFRELTTQRNQAKADVELLSEMLSEFTNTNTPKRNDYSSIDEYQAAMAEFREILKTHKSNLDVAQSKVQKIDSKIQSEEEASWGDHIAEANIPDYDEKVSKANIPVSQEAYQAILSMKKDGPSVVYYLATNPEIAYSLSKLPVYEQLLELGTIKASLQKKAEQPPVAPVVTPNTPPAQRASSQGTVSNSIQDSTPEERATWSHEKWLKWRKNQKE